jgi:hypothetical protein
MKFPLAVVSAVAFSCCAPEAWSASRATSPEPYVVTEDRKAGVLTFKTEYYEAAHDLRSGGALTRITLGSGAATNLLASPLAVQVKAEDGTVYSDLRDSDPTITRSREGLNEVLLVGRGLRDDRGRSSGFRVITRYEYRWGYIKIRSELIPPPGGFRAREVCLVSARLASALEEYGYREGLSEEEGAPPFAFGSNRWGKLRPGLSSDAPVQTPCIPLSVMFVAPGKAGLEWFCGSDLSQWDLQLAGRRGLASFRVARGSGPDGIAFSVAPLSVTSAIALTNRCLFDYYLAFPIPTGRAAPPWLHTSFNRNRGNWVSASEIQQWKTQGYQTVHCHNDGDYFDDGLFWRDGSYPPYPDMDRFDQVLKNCHEAGIRTATYFSNKELHPSTQEFQAHGQDWGRKDRKGGIQHNFFKAQSEFGVQMCLRSGWLDFLKSSIDRVLKNHPLDGVYYDWNVALFCCNPKHETSDLRPGSGRHWDMDELLDLMEWTRQRVGPQGLVIVHNTTTPMFATENFSDYVVATEWGYGKWTNSAPPMEKLPLEWSLAGARPRGVISYGTIDAAAPRRLHRVFAMQAFLGGVCPWPASPETFDLLPVFRPIKDFESCRFQDWRNTAVRLGAPGCASAIYSRPGEAFALLANLEPAPREINCIVDPERLPYPMKRLTSARLVFPPEPKGAVPALDIDARQLSGPGAKLTLPGDSLLLLNLR